MRNSIESFTKLYTLQNSKMHDFYQTMNGLQNKKKLNTGSKKSPFLAENALEQLWAELGHRIKSSICLGKHSTLLTLPSF